MNIQFDEILVGQSSGDFNSRMEEELKKAQDLEIEEENKPLEERIKSKNWKIRKNAYTEILNSITANPNSCEKFTHLYNPILEDQHATCQEIALDISKNMLETYTNAYNLAPEIFKNILEKCYTSSRATLKQKAKEILCLSLEISLDSAPICDIIKTCLENKAPKIQQASLSILTYLINQFSPYKIEYRQFVHLVEKITENATPAVRQEAIEFYKELYKWLMDSIKPYINKLKDVMQKDLEKIFDELKTNGKCGNNKVLKCLKSDKGNKVDNVEMDTKMMQKKEEEKIFENTEAVELFQGKFNESWTEEILSKERKWTEKKDMLECFITASNVIKINNSSKGHIIAAFLILLEDNNINVINSTIIAINNLAKGLRKDFHESREFLTPLLDKFKEKRSNLVTSVFTCLENVMTLCLNIDEVLPDLKDFILSEKNKNISTQTKENYCLFIEKCILKTNLPVLKKVCKTIAEIMFKLTEDPCGDVRTAACKTIGAIKARVGEIPISKILNEICDIKKKKIDDFSKEVVVDPIYEKDDSFGVNNKPPLATKMPNIKPLPKYDSMMVDNNVEMNDLTISHKPVKNSFSKNNDDVEMANFTNTNAPITQKSQSTVGIKQKNTSTSTSHTNNTKSCKPQGQDAEAAEQEDNTSLSNEDIENIICEKIGYDNISLFNDNKWENRKTAFINLSEHIPSNIEDTNKSIDVYLRFIKIKLKDYKENNFNVLKEAINVLQVMCENLPSFGKKHSLIIIKKLVEKISDGKVKVSIFNLFMKLMEYHTPKYISSFLLKHCIAQVKTPNVLKEISGFMEKVLDEFGISVFTAKEIKEIVEFAKFLANNTNPQLRNAATTLLCCMYKYIGPNLKKFLTDIKEATLKVIESAFELIVVINTNESTSKRELKGEALIEQQNSGNTGNMTESLFPRIDISKKITAKLVKEINDGKWQAKKEALETIEKTFNEANNKILPIGLSDLVTCLKNKLSDGNKNMVRSIIQFISKLVEALGPASKNFSKVLISPILNNLSDKMNLLREDVIKCMDKWTEMIGFESILSFTPGYLMTDNFELRSDLLKLILKNKSALIKYDSSKELIPGILSCLLDKTPSVRSLAEEVAKEMLKTNPINNFYIAMKDYKPAVASGIKQIIEKYSSLICVDPMEEMHVTKNVETVFKQPENNNNRGISQNQKKVINTNNQNATNNNANPNNLPKIQKNKRDSTSSNDSNSKKNKNKKTNQNTMINIKPIVNHPTNIEVNNNNLLPVATKVPLLINSNIKFNQKNKRLENEKNLKFPHEFITQEYDYKLKNLMTIYIEKQYIDNAYSTEVTKFGVFFSNINQIMKTDSLHFLEVSDIFLKWILIRNLEMNTNFFFNDIIFEFIKNLYDLLKENECYLHEIENKILIEVLISKTFILTANAKLRSKQFINDYIISGLFSLDTLCNMICDKINNINDVGMRIELIEILKNMFEKNNNLRINYLSTIRNFVNILENVGDEAVKNIVVGIINNIYSNNKLYCENAEEEIIKMLNENKRIAKIFPFAQISQNSEKIQIPKFLDQNILNSYSVPINVPSFNAINFSKSPILPLVKRNSLLGEETSSKESLALIDTLDQNKINKMLDVLYTRNVNEKIKVILELNEIITNKYSESVIILEKNIDGIIKAFKDLLHVVFSQKIEDNIEVIDLLKYLLTVFYKVALTKDLTENCDIETIYNTFEEILKCILYEGLENIGQNEEGKKINKSLNALILKFMETFQTTATFISLIKIIQNYRADNSRICSLAIKCLLKLSNIIPSIIQNIEIDRILLSISEFIFDFEKTNPDLIGTTQNEEMCLKILRAIVNEFIKIKNEGIWNYYKSAIERNNLPDKYLKRWIQLILRNRNGLSAPNSVITSNRLEPVFSPISNQNLFSASNTNTHLINSVNSATINTCANANSVNKYENEIKFYVDKLNKCSCPGDNDIKDKILCELVAIVKRNKINLDCLQGRINEGDYESISNLFNAVSGGCGNKKEIRHENEIDKENVLLNTTNNNLNTSVTFKTLQDYRNKFHGLNERSEQKNLQQKSPSPFRQNNIQEFIPSAGAITQQEPLINLENRKQIMDNFMKNKEMLKNKQINNQNFNSNINHSNNLENNNYLEQSENNNENNEPYQYKDKLNEMKRRLQFLRANKN